VKLLTRGRAFVAITTAAVALTAPSPVHAATDTTPPSLSLPSSADFVVGSVIGLTSPDAEGPVGATVGISMRARWSASDASGICGYSTQPAYAGAPGDWSPWSSATSLTQTTTDYDDQYGGGGSKLLGYTVRARDCAGNTTDKYVGLRPVVAQEDGATFYYGDVIGIPAYTGQWAVSSCACWSGGGTTRKTTQVGASVTFTGGPNRTALVMAKGPDRGSAKVYVNGVLRATVSTYSATKVNRAVVWNGATSLGTVKVVNAGTAGHPRIDLDAVLVD
jgi:hypothetical protein